MADQGYKEFEVLSIHANPYRAQQQFVRPLTRDREGRVARGVGGGRAHTSGGASPSPRVKRAQALAAYNETPGVGGNYKVPSPPKSRAKTPMPDWGEYAVGNATDTLLEDLREAKSSLQASRTEVLQLRAENSRFEQAMREQEKRIMRLSEGPCSASQETALDARRSVEKCVLVRQLKEQIVRLRQEVGDKDLALKTIQRQSKANSLAQLATEKEEYYFECIRLRQVVISLRQDMAAEIANRQMQMQQQQQQQQHPYLTQYQHQHQHQNQQQPPYQHLVSAGLRFPRQSNEIEAGLRLEISRLAAGFQDILTEMSEKEAADGPAPAYDRAPASAPAPSSSDGLSASLSSREGVLRVNPSALDRLEREAAIHASAATRAEAHSLPVSPINADLSRLMARPEVGLFPSPSPVTPLVRPVAAGGLVLESVESVREGREGREAREAREGEAREGTEGGRRDQRSAEEAAPVRAKTPVPPQQKSPSKRGKGSSRARELKDAKAAANKSKEVAAASEPSHEKEEGCNEGVDEVVAEEAPVLLLDPAYRANLVQQMRDVFRRVLFDGAVQVDVLFNHLDADGDGDLTAMEIHQGLGMLPAFAEISLQQVQAVLEELDDDANGRISVEEFRAFVNEESKKKADELVPATRRMSSYKRAETAAAAASDVHTVSAAPALDECLPDHASLAEFASGVRNTFKKTVQDGYSLEEFFAEMDADGDGLISAGEMQAILVRYRYFRNVTLEQISALLGQVAAAYHGNTANLEPTLEDFKRFLDAEEKEAGASVIAKMMRKKFSHESPPSSPIKAKGPDLPAETAPSAAAPLLVNTTTAAAAEPIPSLEDHPDTSFVHKARHAFRQLVKSGISVDALFASMDTDDSGALSTDELQATLRQQEVFQYLGGDDISKLFRVMDGDGNGQVSQGEFKAFLKSEKRHAAAATLQAQLRGRASRGKRIGAKPARTTTHKKGDKVQGCFRGAGTWFPATVRAANKDGTYSLLYDDGDVETDAKAEYVRAVGEAPGEEEPGSPDAYDSDFETLEIE